MKKPNLPIVLKGLSALRQLRIDIEDAEVLGLLAVVLNTASKVDDFLSTNDPTSKSTEGMCLALSQMVNSELKEKGYKALILEGEIEVDPDSWLEHHVSFVRFSEYWITVDFAINQLPKYENLEVLIMICDADKTALKEALLQTYGWWTGT